MKISASSTGTKTKMGPAHAQGINIIEHKLKTFK